MPNLLDEIKALPPPITSTLGEIQALPPPYDPQAANDARIASTARKTTLNSLQSTGIPTTPLLPDFDPPPAGDRTYLTKHTGGTLDLNLDTVSPTKLGTSALNMQAQFLVTHPSAAQLLSDPGPDADPLSKENFKQNYGRLTGHYNQLAAIKEVPTSPKEKLSSLGQAWQDWSTAELFGGLTGATVPDKYPARQQVPPGNAVNILSKLVDTDPRADDAERTLRLGTLSPEEKQAFSAMGGWDSVYYAQSREPYYTQRTRLSKLTGEPVGPPQQPHKIYANQIGAARDRAAFPEAEDHFDGASTVPRSLPLSLESLQPVSSFARTTLQSGAALAAWQAQQAADADSAFAQTPIGSVIGGRAARSLSESFLDQPTGEAAFQETSPAGRLSSRLLGASTGLAVKAGSDLLANYGPVALNVALLGVPSTVAEGLHTTMEATGEALTGDKDTLFRGYQYVKQAAVRRLALGGDETDKSLVRNADALFASHPDADPMTRIDLGAQYYPSSLAVSSLLKRSQESSLLRFGTQLTGLSTPLAREAFGGLIDASTDTADGLVMTGTGMAGLYNYARRGFAPRVLKDPLKAKAFTEFEKGLGGAGSYSGLAPELRGKLLEPITAELDRVRTPDQATALLDRYARYLKQEGVPVTPESAAQVASAADKIATLDEKLASTKLSKEAKQAIHSLKEPIADLPEIDQQFILRGDEAYISPEGSARRVDRVVRWLKSQQASAEALADPTGVGEIALGELHDAQKGLLEQSARTNEFVKRQHRLFEVTGDLRKTLVRERDLLEGQVKEHLNLAEATATSWNNFLAGETDLASRIETHGVPVDSPNPATRTPRFKKLATAIVDKDAAALSELFEKDLGWQNLKKSIGLDYGVSEGYGVPIQDRLNRALLDHAKSELKNSLRPVPTNLGPLPEPSKHASTISQRLQAAAQEGTFLKLSKEEHAWLNDWRKARNLDEIPREPVHLKSLVKTAEDYHARLKATEKALKAATDFRDNLMKATPDKGFQIPMQRELVSEIRARLAGEASTFLGDTYAALSHEASAAELSGLQAFDEATKRYSAEHHLLEKGFQKISSIELSWLSTQNPVYVRHFLEDFRRNAQGDLNRYARRLQEIDAIAGKQLTTAERFQLTEDIKSGKPRSDAAATVLQHQRRVLLDELYDSGHITADQHQSYVKEDYFHYSYSDEAKPALDEAVKLNPPRLPPKFSPLAVDSREFLGFRKPENDYYVAYRERPGTPIQYVVKDPGTQATWSTKAAAEDWLASPSNHIPAGSEVAVKAPWLLSDRDIAGLIGEPISSHADLLAKASRTISTSRLTSGLRQTPFIRTEADLLRRSNIGQGAFNDSRTVFQDGKTTWTKIDNPKLPHLHNTYASKEILTHLRLYEESLPWVSATAEALAEGTSIWKNALIDPRMKVFAGTVKAGGALLKGTNNAFTTARVGLSPTSVAQNLSSNLFYSHFTGLSPFTRPLAFMKGSLDYFRARYLSPTADKYLDALYGRDLIRPAGLKDGEIIVKNLDVHWNSVSALHERIAKLELQSEAHLAAGRPEAAARVDVHLTDLREKAAAQSKVAYKGFLQGLMGLAQRRFEDFAGVLKGRGKFNTGLWNVYGELGLDNAIKYANLKHLVEEKGFSMDDALRRVETFTQQLHRVPKFIKDTTNKVGGALFVGYQYEQLRILGAIMRHAPVAALMTSGAVMAANAGTLAVTGENERDFLESHAFDMGLERSSLTDLHAMAGRLLLPNSRGGVSSMSLGPFSYDVLVPQSKAFQGINATLDETVNSAVGRGTLGATVRAVKTSALGVMSKFAGADLVSEGLRALFTQETTRGDPLKTGWDWIKYGIETFTPPGVPGSPQYQQTRNVLADSEVNPRTGVKTSPLELVESLLVRARPMLDSPTRFQTAMAEALKGRGELYNFQRTVAYDDMLNTMLARGGARNPDGSLDTERATPLAEEFYRSHPVTYLDPITKQPVPTPRSAEQISKALKRHESPGAITSFTSLPLDRQIEIYALWRSVDRDAPKRDTRWTELVRNSVISKLLGGRAGDLDSVESAHRVTEEWLTKGSLPKDAADDIKGWDAYAIKLFARAQSNRR